MCGYVGLGRFRYMTVSVQRGGQLRYMTTSVHVNYDFGTSLYQYRYIARECLSFYAEGLQMLNGCFVCYVKLLMCN